MELHFEVIRDKEAIYAELVQSQSQGHQLAICYNKDDKLAVKICTVKDIVRRNDKVAITLHSGLHDASTEEIALDIIESIYPLHFYK